MKKDMNERIVKLQELQRDFAGTASNEKLWMLGAANQEEEEVHCENYIKYTNIAVELSDIIEILEGISDEPLSTYTDTLTELVEMEKLAGEEESAKLFEELLAECDK